MSKTCPNCGVNSPDNAKFCIECAYDLSDVEINKEEVKTPESSDEGFSKLGCIVLIAIVAVVIVAAGFFIFGSGEDDSAPDNFQITFDKVESTNFVSDGKTYYDYWVDGFVSGVPKDSDKYMLKTIYYDSSGKELISTTEKLSQFKDDEKYDFASMIGFYQGQQYLNVDHVSIQLIKDNEVIKDFNTTVNANQLSSPDSATNST